ncbi:MAG: hypothetical protein L0Y58_12740, partial [Verrucomicrobia subdivision 3 bacterium]|nr:hypothetical protein [Limisphaerales bacterium]
PPIEWQRSFGGTNGDTLYALLQTSDGGFILGGESASGATGNKTSANFGGQDFWVVRLDPNGNKVWDYSFGGSGSDVLFSLQQTSDGGFVLGGSSDSAISGNKSAAKLGARDFWVVRLDASGNKLWDRSFGGTGEDVLFGLQNTADGGFLIGGFSSSGISGNKTSQNLGGNDFWVVRLNANGSNVWDKSFGGTEDDGIYSLQQTGDGGFILAGNSYSASTGNKTSTNFGSDDIWIARLDASGNKLWDRSFGGSGDDGFFNVAIQQTADGGFVLGGDSTSPADGNKTSAPFGQDDFWVIRLDANGNKLWDRSFGGQDNDYLTSLTQTTDGGFLLGGGSNSGTNSTKTSMGFGLTDFWVVRVDTNGNRLWDKSFGGTAADGFFNVSLRSTSDGGFLLGGDSRSGINGNKTAAGLGSEDFWIVKLNGAQPLRLRAVAQSNIGQSGFRFFLSGAVNAFYVIDYSLNLVQWTPLRTNQLNAAEVEITDLEARTDSHRFYRARNWP